WLAGAYRFPAVERVAPPAETIMEDKYHPEGRDYLFRPTRWLAGSYRFPAVETISYSETITEDKFHSELPAYIFRDWRSAVGAQRVRSYTYTEGMFNVVTTNWSEGQVVQTPGEFDYVIYRRGRSMGR